MRSLIVLASFLAATAYASPDPLTVENTETLSATVVSIDQQTRIVTLKADNGATETVQVAPDVRNLAQVKAGDKIVVRYYEGLAAQIRKKGDPAPTDVQAAGAAARAPEGQKPAGVVGTTVNSLAIIESVDKKANTVTFTNENGTHTVAVKKPEAQKFIAGLKKGDQVDITYTQALAVSVEPAK